MATENTRTARGTRELVRWTGFAGIIGGLILTLAAILHAFEPTGCIGAECETRPMRTASSLVAVLAPVAAVLILIGLAGLALMARQPGRGTRLATVGVSFVAAGVLILVSAGVVQTFAYGGDFPLMPFFVIPAMLCLIVGVVLLGVFVIRSGVLPRWLGIVLAASGVLLLLANEQTAAVLLSIPFGLAMVALGSFMWTRGSPISSAARRSA